MKCISATTSLFKDPFNPKRLDPSLSGKMKVLDYLLAITRKKTDDRWVLISNYTQTMDQFIEVGIALNFRYEIFGSYEVHIVRNKISFNTE